VLLPVRHRRVASYQAIIKNDLTCPWELWHGKDIIAAWPKRRGGVLQKGIHECQKTMY
jgi:hypothetical protein